MTNLEYIMDFSLKFAEALLVSGANLERVNDSVYRICDSYGCREVHFFSLNCYLSLSLEGKDGEQVCTHRCIQAGVDTHLEKVHRLNELSRHVCRVHPDPESLEKLLEEAENVTGYSNLSMGIARLCAMAAISGMNGATFKDLLIILLNSLLLYLAGIYVNKPGLNRIVYNVLCTLVAGTIAIFMRRIGFVDNFYVVLIVNSMMLIPGIPAVNAIRNMLCGNEINGILEFFKAVLETGAIVGGFVISIFLFGGDFL